MSFFYYCVAFIVIRWIQSLFLGIVYLKEIREALTAPPPDYQPPVAVILPCRGVDPEFRENIRELIEQDYPRFEIIFVVDSQGDPAYQEIVRVISESSTTNTHVIEAGRAHNCSQKVHNLLAALDYVGRLNSGRSGRAPARAPIEVYVFTDSDAQRKRSWLRYMVAPLGEDRLGATTGYRWYMPEGSFSSLLRSMWNAPHAAGLSPRKGQFAWGGSTAIKRVVAEQIRLRDYWRGTASDDVQLSKALRKSRQYVKFVPQCLLPSRGDCSFRELLEFTTRQFSFGRACEPV